MSADIKTWQQRISPAIHSDFLKRGYGMAHAAMFAEIAELRAALAATQADLEEWRFTNKVDELGRALATSERRNLELQRIHAERGLQIERLDVALARATAIPAGSCLVPIVPTTDMIVAFAEQWYIKCRAIDDCEMEDCYAAMLAAAPGGT